MKFKAEFKLFIILFFAGVLLAHQVFAAPNADDLDVLNLEEIYKKEETKVPVPAAPIAPMNPTNPTDSSLAPTDEVAAAEEKEEQKSEEIRVQELKDLNQLVPFSEISVIQKKYMPKTGRFQFFAGASLATNTPWYQNYGGKLNLGYNFTESFGLELATLFLTSSARSIVKEIKDNNNVEAEQFVYTKGYYGLHLMWSPIYGKISYDNKKIINYEMYFALGGGTSTTNSQEKNVSTVHVGVGQIFSITKSMAFRWDYGFNMFQATPTLLDSSGKAEKNTYNDLVLTAGVSFFFPEASYR